MRWLNLIFWIILCFAVAGISGMWTAGEVAGWYRTLTRPSFAPPDWVFGPVWTLLYAMMAIAAWLVATSNASTPAAVAARNWGVAIFLVQLALNFGWSLIFFRWHAIGAALIEVIVMWLAIGATILLFSKSSKIAALLLVPYLAWVTFASALNAGFWFLNRR
jgi:tryptophan-rich sensory protein